MPASSRPPADTPPPSLTRPELEAIMVIQLARLGDFLQTTPLLAALSAQHPRARLAVAVAPAVVPLARACPYVEQILPIDPASLEDAARAPGPPDLALARLRGLCQPLWQEPAQEVYNLNLSPAAACLAAGWSGARLRGWRPEPGGHGLVGEAWAPFVMQVLADRRLTRLHLSDILASYAGPPGPANPPLPRLAQRVDPEALAAAGELVPTGGPLVVLQLGANHDLRRWPLENFALLARGLARQGATLVLSGSSRERVLARRLSRLLPQPAPPVCNLMGLTDLPTLSGVLARADLVVSADTGTLHLATAVGARVLALYMGPAQVHETGPYGQGHLVLQARDHCGPCLEDRPTCQGLAPCRRLITPGAALQAALGLLAGRPAPLAAAGLDLPAGVEALVGEMDDFGQRYRPIVPRPLSLAGGLALALRQAGRRLLRPWSGARAADWRGSRRRENPAADPQDIAAQADQAGQAGQAGLTNLTSLTSLALAARRVAGAAGRGDAAAQGLLALCQAGRRQTRPRPGARAGDWRGELRDEHLPPGPRDAADLAGLASAARRLAEAAERGDAAAAQGLLAQAPGLASLARMVGQAPVPGLEEACQEAAEVLALAAGE
ncbi:MAG: glycosyltransferase family 9 protein [Pseudomonadota bacterium]